MPVAFLPVDPLPVFEVGVLRIGRLAFGLAEQPGRLAGLGGLVAGGLPGTLGLAAERFVVPVEHPGDVHLLGDAQHGLADVVDDECGNEEDLEHGEEHRQVLHQLLLRLRHGRADRRTSGDHALLDEVQATEQQDEQDVGEGGAETLGDRVDRRLRQVDAERLHRVLPEERLVQGRVDRKIARDEAGIGRLGLVPECPPHRRGDGLSGAVGLVGQAVEHPEHDEEDGHLRHQRQTRGHGIDLVLLVELHHLFVELRLVVAMLVLQLAHLRREPLHLEHALRALQREWRGHRP